MRRSWFIGLVVLAALFTAMTSAAATAPAGFSGGNYSGCSNAWTTNPYGGEVFGYAAGEAVGTNSKVTVPDAYSEVYDPTDCGPGGYTITMPRVTITTNFTLVGTKLSSCSAGIPAGFTCTGSSTSETTSYSATCTNTTSCKHTFANLTWYSGSGGNFNAIYMSLTVTLSGPNGATTFGVDRHGLSGF